MSEKRAATRRAIQEHEDEIDELDRELAEWARFEEEDYFWELANYEEEPS